MVFQMSPSGVPTPGIVILSTHTLEGRRLVDGYTGAPMLVLMVCVGSLYRRTQRRESIGLPRAGQ